jgi:hypothetical protein
VDENFLAPLIPIVAIVGGLSIAAYSMYLRMKARNFVHEERLAMIEKGLTPPPLTAADVGEFPKRRRSSRHTGVILIAIGIGLGVVAVVNSGARGALGASGLLVVMGLGFLVNAMLDRREAAKTGPRTP